MISVEEALGFLSRHALPRRIERISLSDARGRILAEPVHARLDQPAAAVSAMDGYAVRFSDLQAGQKHFDVIGESAAGAPFEGRAAPGEAVRIFTGAILPDGADHVVIQENTIRSGARISVSDSHDDPANVRARGIDFLVGQCLVGAGTRLGAAELALIAAGNVPEVSVLVPLRVGILANGNELKPVGSELAHGEIINSNALSLAALFQDWGADVIDLGIAGDSVDAILEKIRARADIDLFVPVGGASVGDHDHMYDAFTEAGFTEIFRKVAVKPGKPTWFSTFEDQRVLGLPGNPASALVCAQLFVGPLLGQEWQNRLIPARLAVPLSPNGPRETWLRASVHVSDTGHVTVGAIASNQDSSLIRPFTEMNALLRRGCNAEAATPGEMITVLVTGRLTSFPTSE